MWGAVYVVAMIVFAVGLITIFACSLSRCVFTCKSCGGEFMIAFRRALWVQHFNSDYILNCPICGKKGWCTARRTKERGE